MKKQLSDKQKAVLSKAGYNWQSMKYQEAADKIGEILSGVKASEPKDVTKQFIELDKDRLIVRQCALKAAVELYYNKVPANETIDLMDAVLDSAKRFEEWIFR